MQKAETKLVAAIAFSVPNRETSASQPFRYLLSSDQKVVIGRDRSCQIVIDSTRYTTVSRLHVEIRASNVPQIWEICDLNTSNGTYINDKQLKGCHILQTGDRIKLSQSGPEFVFECQMSSVPPPAVAQSVEMVEPAPAEVNQPDVAQLEQTTGSQTNLPPAEKASTLASITPVNVVAQSVAVNQPDVAQLEQKNSSSPSADSLSPSPFPPVVKATQKSLWQLGTQEDICTFSGHSNSVCAVAFSPDGKTLASGSADKTIKLWNISTGEEVATLSGHRLSVEAVAFSPDGKTLASGSADKTIKLWNISMGEEIATLSGHRLSVEAVAFSLDGKTIASGSADKTIKLWNISTGEEITTLSGHRLSVEAVAFSLDGKTLASGSADKTIKLWNISTGEESTLSGHRSSVNSLTFSPDGQILASGSEDKTIKLWNLSTGEEMRTIAGYGWQVGAIAISSDGQTFASGSEDKTIKIWQL